MQEIRLLTASNATRTKELNDARFDLEALTREKEEKDKLVRELGEEMAMMREGSLQQELEQRLAAKREECEEKSREVERLLRELEEAKVRKEELLEERETRTQQMNKMGEIIERLEEANKELDARLVAITHLNHEHEEWLREARELLAKEQEETSALKASNAELDSKVAQLEREKAENEQQLNSDIEAMQSTKKDLWAKVRCIVFAALRLARGTHVRLYTPTHARRCWH
jgi:chromosome segregation ATPase